jgi:hypothetical protein
MQHTSLRKLIDPAGIAGGLPSFGASPAVLAGVGLLTGLAGSILIAVQHPVAGLAALLLGWLLLGWSGLVAARIEASGLAAQPRVAFEFIVYASIPFAFALAEPGRALAAGFLTFGIASLAASSAKESQGLHVVEHGIARVAFAAACLWPNTFSIAAYVLGVLCFLAAGLRIARLTVSSS